MTVRVAACQVRLAVGDVAGNRAAVRGAVRRAIAAGARLVVVPELAGSGYVFRDAEEARELAEPADGPTVREWCALAARADVALVGGFAERGADGRLHNSAAVVDRTGVRAVYRKVHLWDAEKLVFRAGDQAPPVVTVQAGDQPVNLGVLICYDLEFPEWVRLAALAGAEVLAVPTNWPAEPIPGVERSIQVVYAQAAAAANRIYLAAADRCGTERGVDWVGGSVIVAPSGYPAAGPAESKQETVLVADCDLATARSKANSPRNDVHADRRPTLYHPLVSGKRR